MFGEVSVCMEGMKARDEKQMGWQGYVSTRSFLTEAWFVRAWAPIVELLHGRPLSCQTWQLNRLCSQEQLSPFFQSR